MKFHVQIITPESVTFETDAEEIIVPTTQGEISVLPMHVPLLAHIAPGELIIKSDNKTDHLVVAGGFLDVQKGSVKILADYAIHGKEISAVQANEAKKRAEEKMKEKLSDQDFRIAEGELRKAIIELRVANKVRSRQL